MPLQVFTVIKENKCRVWNKTMISYVLEGFHFDLDKINNFRLWNLEMKPKKIKRHERILFWSGYIQTDFEILTKKKEKKKKEGGGVGWAMISNVM